MYILLLLIPLSGIMYILGLHQRLGLVIYGEQYIGLLLGLLLAGTFLGIPAGKRSSKISTPWYDWILSALGLYAGLYLTIFYPSIVMKLTTITPGRIIVATVAIVLVLEAIRR